MSCSRTVTIAMPSAVLIGVNDRTPAAEIDGCTLKSALLLLLTMKFSVWPDSSAAPALMPVAHGVDCAPAVSSTATIAAPEVKAGA